MYEDPDTVGVESWTIQCEVLRHKPPGFSPPQADPVPVNNMIQQALPFDFFGLGQPINDNAENEEQQDGQGEGNAEQEGQHNGQDD